MPHSSAAQAALVKWVNLFAGERRPAKSVDDLADGFMLGQVLHDLDPTYDTSELVDTSAASSKWLTQKRNLQSIYKGLFKYMRREAPECLPLAQVADFRAVAEHPDAEGLTQLTAVLLATAALGALDKEVRAKYITRVQTELEPVVQNAIRQVLEEKQTQMRELAAKAKEEEALDDRDPDLVHEEERARLEASLDQKVHELDMATKRYADLNSRHSYLQENHDEVKAKLAEVENELTELRKLHGADESQRVQALQSKIDEQGRLIEQLEEDVENYKQAQQQLEINLEKYKASSEEGQEYKDKYDELQHHTQELERKANAADRYKQKLANNRNLEQEITNLQFELDARKDQEQKLQKVLLECEKLRNSEKEMLTALARSEQAVDVEKDRTKHLQLSAEDAAAEVQRLRLQNAMSERHIEDLKEQLTGMGEAPRAPSPSSQTGEVGNLEHELQQTTNDFSKVKLLEAEVEVLRHGAATSSQADDLRRELDRARKERDIAMSQYNSIFEKHGVAQEQIDALIANMSGEGHVAYNSMREQLAQATREIDELKHRTRKLEEQAKDKDRENLSMKTDLDAVGSDRLDALERLKQSDQLIAASLRSELESLRERYNGLEIENSMHKSQLLDALVAKEKLSKEKELEGPPAHLAPEGVSQAELDDRVKDYKSKTDKLRDRVKLQKEQLEKADQERLELQKQLRALESGSALAAQKAAHEQIIKNLQRENAMISTAWYDLTSRLQSNHVVLQRKDQPKSWLNKQRQMVNATPRR
ncbi:hypothetical protein KVR01_009861 [Diaporthe batatas]|uniref:uncharacterized protein n=1 Tax=Diaporthe batatas TaxID=748121 RepID=UPI001D04429B|nr:uncharacterized protein KVR01_009861 [Diaporthe batatas]KAG8160325.1 hypothetical protein KVR01_009861 [Diaporthe batatas]